MYPLGMYPFGGIWYMSRLAAAAAAACWATVIDDVEFRIVPPVVGVPGSGVDWSIGLPPIGNLSLVVLVRVFVLRRGRYL